MSYSGGYGRDYVDDDLNDDVEEGEGDGQVRSSNDHIILLIDARTNMFEAVDASGTTAFQACLATAVQVMKNKIVQSDKHRVGVTFFGTKNTSDKDENNPNVFVALDLATPNAERIRDMDALAKGEMDFDSTYGGSLGEGEAHPLRSGLWSCHTEFMTIKQPNDHKRIFLLTNNDDPMKEDEDEKKKLYIVAKDAKNASIEIQLFHLKRGGAPFDSGKFYRAIITGDGDDYNEQSLGEGAEGSNQLMEKIRRKEFKKRRLTRMPFHLCEAGEGVDAPPAVSFDVQVFNMVHPAKRPYPIHLEKKSNRPMQIMSKLMDDKTGAQLDDHEVRTYLEFAGERAYVSKDEMAGLKALFHTGITLLGFRAMETLRPDFNVRSPYFFYPDEESTLGSAKAFISLHGAMLAKKVYALARFTRASGAAPRVMALLPQEELLEDGMQVLPPGLNAVILPYADEVREPKAPEDGDIKPEVNEAGVSAAESLVKALKLDALDCHQFENPVLQRHYAALQAIALSEEEVSWDPEKDDTTRPNEEGVDAAIASVLDTFKATYGGDQEDDMPVAGAKRAAGGGAGGAGKKIKADGDSNTINWQEALAQGQIEGFTLPTLKTFLKSRGLSVAGKKGDLVDRVKQALGKG